MNFQSNMAMFAPEGPDPEIIDLRDGRREMAFNYCFVTTYPDNSEERMRNCAQSFKKYCKIV